MGGLGTETVSGLQRQDFGSRDEQGRWLRTVVCPSFYWCFCLLSNPRGLKQHNFILLCIISVTWVPDPRGKVLTDPSSFLETLKMTDSSSLLLWSVSVFPTPVLFFPSSQAPRGTFFRKHKLIIYAGSRLPRESIALQKNSESSATSPFCHLQPPNSAFTCHRVRNS